MALVPQSPASFTGTPKMAASDLIRSSSTSIFGTPLNTKSKVRSGTRSISREGSVFTVKANMFSKFNFINPLKKPKPEQKQLAKTESKPEKFPDHFTDFKPMKGTRKPIRLAFEKPLIEIEEKIADLKRKCAAVGFELPPRTLRAIESKYKQTRERVFRDLTPIQRVNIARHPHRPTFLDHIINITDRFTELHGDRAGYDDPAIVCGLGKIDGQTYMFVGQQKGRNTKENVKRNFGMPTPHGYRKALRFFRYADHFGFPIVTFVDTPGAFADLKSEYLGQAEAIAMNLREMFGFKVPIITIVLGEGGSGGALAIAVCNKMLMLENSVFFVASPEACASILWKKARLAPKAARKLKITARELVELDLADAVIPEPIGGAHSDPKLASKLIKTYIKNTMNELSKMSKEELLSQRYQKFRKMGRFTEEKTPEFDISPQAIEKLKMNMDDEYNKALSAIGFKATVDLLERELQKARTPAEREELENKLKKVKLEVNQHLPTAPNYPALKSHHDMMRNISRAQSIAKVKQELGERLKRILDNPDTRERFDRLKTIIKDDDGDQGDLHPAVKILYFNERKKLQYQIAKVLSSFLLLSNTAAFEKGKYLAKKAYSEEYEDALEEVVNGVMKDTEEVVRKSPKLKRKMELVTRLYLDAKGKPDAEPSPKIQALVTDVRRRIRKGLAAREAAKVKNEPKPEPEVKSEAETNVQYEPIPKVKRIRVNTRPKTVGPELKFKSQAEAKGKNEPGQNRL
uniref:acetyl-CoA carboxytransferase n=1 Tax=Geranium incanum TaxID=1158081 RepID=A0A286SC09_9ROSI|nr:acetyl-CoA carboxylase subunit alpha [Geranium incanum]